MQPNCLESRKSAKFNQRGSTSPISLHQKACFRATTTQCLFRVTHLCRARTWGSSARWSAILSARRTSNVDELCLRDDFGAAAGSAQCRRNEREEKSAFHGGLQGSRKQCVVKE
jgi:hypothetical protein